MSHSSDQREPVCGLDEIERHLDDLLGEEYVSADYVRFTRNVLRAQRKVCEALNASGEADIPCGRMHDASVRSITLTRDDILFPDSHLAGLFEEICDATGGRGEASDELVSLRDAVAREPAILKRLARNLALHGSPVELKELSDRAGVPVPTMLLVGRLLAVPFVTVAARRIRRSTGWHADEEYNHGFCPMCGAPSVLAILRREDGKRLLYCAMCGQRWAVSRIMCPFCGNRDQESLGLLVPSPGDARWIEMCGACKRYIKTVDERKLPGTDGVVPVVEETISLHLDMLAEREGYVRPLFGREIDSRRECTE